jgi:hypothetical protein
MANTDDELKKAYRAFKKKLKMQQLDDDSRLGRSALTGARSTITAIQPPSGSAARRGKSWPPADTSSPTAGGYTRSGPSNGRGFRVQEMQNAFAPKRTSS